MEILSAKFFPRHTRLKIRFRHHLYSGQLPDLVASLLVMLPRLKEHVCHNRNNLPFIEEVHDTELGHVFEHVILEVLRQRDVHLRGQTTWNWHRDPLGTYHVTINTGKKMIIKEGLLVAQAIFTNALVGPMLRVHLPEVDRSRSGPQPLPVYAHTSLKPAQLLFATGQEARRAKVQTSTQVLPVLQSSPARLPKSFVRVE